jgi:hypothetical protein
MWVLPQPYEDVRDDAASAQAFARTECFFPRRQTSLAVVAGVSSEALPDFVLFSLR